MESNPLLHLSIIYLLIVLESNLSFKED